MIFVPDLEKDAVGDFADLCGRSYLTFIAAPVRSGHKAYGLLTVDSDVAGSLTNIDVRYVSLVAALIGAGYGRLDTWSSDEGARHVGAAGGSDPVDLRTEDVGSGRRAGGRDRGREPAA